MRVQALATEDAQRLLARVSARPLASEVSNRFIIETAGNPLAILEHAPAMIPTALVAAPLLDEPLPVHSRLQRHFLIKVRALPAPTQTFLQLASADSSADPVLLWHAAKRLALEVDAMAPAESERLIHVGPRVSFRHPLIRSAIYYGMTPAERRIMHSALADAIDSKIDPRRGSCSRAAARRRTGKAARRLRSVGSLRLEGGRAHAGSKRESTAVAGGSRSFALPRPIRSCPSCSR